MSESLRPATEAEEKEIIAQVIKAVWEKFRAKVTWSELDTKQLKMDFIAFAVETYQNLERGQNMEDAMKKLETGITNWLDANYYRYLKTAGGTLPESSKQ